jgi:hypothetical protein
MLGLKMHNFLVESIPHENVGTLGINEKTLPVYKALGYKIGTLNHYYIQNPKFATKFRIAKFPDNARQRVSYDVERKKVMGLSFQIVDKTSDWESLELKNIYDFKKKQPIKSVNFLKNRFFFHPYYKYQIYAISDKEKIVGWLVTRICHAEHSKALRIVELHIDDDLIYEVMNFVERLTGEIDAEYFDFINTGYDIKKIATAGAHILDLSKDNVVIPNYFEPLEQKNIALNFAYKNKLDQPQYIYKADADQDRPNIL